MNTLVITPYHRTNAYPHMVIITRLNKRSSRKYGNVNCSLSVTGMAYGNRMHQNGITAERQEELIYLPTAAHCQSLSANFSAFAILICRSEVGRYLSTKFLQPQNLLTNPTLNSAYRLSHSRPLKHNTAVVVVHGYTQQR